MAYQFIVVDTPRPQVKRITLNRGDKNNPLSNPLRTELFDALISGDQDPDVHVMIIRGAGKSFSAGYDLKADNTQDQPYYSAGGLGAWPRHVVDGFLQIWDLAKPVIAQVHGYCLAGGTELASACDLIYVAEDARIGYPVVRAISPPDNQFFPWLVGMRRAMEMMLSGEAISGIEAAESGFANRAYPADELDDAVLGWAEKLARVPPEIQQINKRAVHRQMDMMGIRAGIRAGTELQTLSMMTRSARDHFKEIAGGLTQALSKRDAAFGDYRETPETNDNLNDSDEKGTPT